MPGLPEARDAPLRSPRNFSTTQVDIPQAAFLKSIFVFPKQFFDDTSATSGDQFGFLHDFHSYNDLSFTDNCTESCLYMLFTLE